MCIFPFISLAPSLARSHATCEHFDWHLADWLRSMSNAVADDAASALQMYADWPSIIIFDFCRRIFHAVNFYHMLTKFQRCVLHHKLFRPSNDGRARARNICANVSVPQRGACLGWKMHTLGCQIINTVYYFFLFSPRFSLVSWETWYFVAICTILVTVLVDGAAASRTYLRLRQFEAHFSTTILLCVYL